MMFGVDFSKVQKKIKKYESDNLIYFSFKSLYNYF